MSVKNDKIHTIFNRSQYIETSAENKKRKKQFISFKKTVHSIIEGFGSKKEAEFLFGKQKMCRPSELLFVPFFQSIRHHFANSTFEDMLLPNAFSEWENSFYEVLSLLFGNIALEVLQDMAGPMTTPTIEWMKQAVEPHLRDEKIIFAISRKYPLCARQIIEFVQHIILHIEEILDALQEWRNEANFANICKGIKVRKISASISDRHNNGKSVHIIEFEDGNQIVYKPHHNSIDIAFQKWAMAFTIAAGEQPFPFPKSVKTKKGSFYEFVKPIPLKDKIEAHEFFRRAGFLMGVIFFLRGNDLHAENIVASGNNPIIIDTETIIAPKGCMLTRVADGQDFYSVNSMSLLPMLQSLPGFREGPFSGICHQIFGSTNLPVYNNQPIAGYDYADDICAGFVKASKTFMNNRSMFKEKLFNLFEGRKVRMVIRPTNVYARLLGGLSAKKAQSAPEYYKKLMGKKIFKTNKLLIEQECAAILKEEQKALDRLDIPFFSEVLDKKLLCGLVKEWEKIDDSLIKQEILRIRFSLARIKPNACTDTVMKTHKKYSGSPKKIATLLSKLLNETMHAITLSREQRYFLLSDAPITATSLLEGNLGTIIALAAYRIAFGSTREIDLTLNKAKAKLLDFVDAAPALTAREMGLADGAAGYILGSTMCYKMNLLTEKQYIKILEQVGRIADDELGIHFGETGLLYGNCGMIYALKKVPKEFITTKLTLLHKRVWDCISSREAYKNYTEKKLVSEIYADMLQSPKNKYPLGNNSLRFGNAGILYRAANQKLKGEYNTSADRLFEYLCKQEQILPEICLPEGCIETGLLHGMPGVLYSICRYLDPEHIPEL